MASSLPRDASRPPEASPLDHRCRGFAPSRPRSGSDLHEPFGILQSACPCSRGCYWTRRASAANPSSQGSDHPGSRPALDQRIGTHLRHRGHRRRYFPPQRDCQAGCSAGVRGLLCGQRHRNPTRPPQKEILTAPWRVLQIQKILMKDSSEAGSRVPYRLNSTATVVSTTAGSPFTR